MSAFVEEHTVVVEVRGLACAVEVRVVVIACDHEGCAAAYVAQGDAVDVATNAAAALGWTCDGGDVDGCPLHPVADGSEGDAALPSPAAAAAERGR